MSFAKTPFNGSVRRRQADLANKRSITGVLVKEIEGGVGLDPEQLRGALLIGFLEQGQSLFALTELCVIASEVEG